MSLTVLERGVYRGPHLYSHTPMIRVMVDLGPLESRPTNTIEGFAEALLERLPHLREHGCSRHRPGGFVERLSEGTWLGHVIEHVALELQTLCGMPVTRGKTRSVRGRPDGVYNVMFAYEDEAVGVAAGRLAFELVESLLPLELRGFAGLEKIDTPLAGVDIDARLADLDRLARRRALGPTTKSIIDAARRRDIPVRRLNDQSLLQLGWGARQKKIQASITSETSHLAVEAAGNKGLAKQLLRQAGLPTPNGAVVRTVEEAQAEARHLNAPVVTKPLDGNHGRGVTTGLTTPEQVARGFQEAAKHSRRVIVEELYTGADYRALVIGGKLVAVAERSPPFVVGDGDRTIADLIEQLNRDERRGEGHEKVMTKVKVGPALHAFLAEQGLAMESKLPVGRRVALVPTANLSTGGSATDRTAVIHPDNVRVCEQAAAVIGLDVAGIDLVCPDIRRPLRETGGGIVEVNAAPGFRMHLEPSVGDRRDVAGPVVDMLFPRPSRARIPLVAITGTNGKSTTVRMVAHILQRQGLTVGYTTTSGVYRNGHLVRAADASGPKSAQMVLADPTVDVAVLETARGGMVREGLGFDRCDVGAVLNVTEDHLGLKDVNTLEDLAAVKSIVTESVSRRGYSVLNGDDPHCHRIARHAGGNIIWFTQQGERQMSSVLHKHLMDDGVVVAVEMRDGRQTIVLCEGAKRTTVERVQNIPATLGGAVQFNVANAVAATAIAFARGVEIPAIAEGLRTFETSFENNPGRLNIYDGHGFKVILDYAHNPAAMRALGGVIQQLRPRDGKVIGMASIPGDRRDEDLRAMGAIATDIFDEVVFRERPDGRGRLAGEVLRLMEEGALQTGCDPRRLSKVLGETDAVERCLSMAEPGDLVVLLPTEVEAVWRQMLDWRPAAQPANDQRASVMHA
jgi:cyanophycin synthetase